jgi:hypothetical protein
MRVELTTKSTVASTVRMDFIFSPDLVHASLCGTLTDMTSLRL